MKAVEVSTVIERTDHENWIYLMAIVYVRRSKWTKVSLPLGKKIQKYNSKF